MDTINPVTAIKKYFERDDNISPGGGKPITTKDLGLLKKALSASERVRFALSCAQQLDCKLDCSKVVGWDGPKAME